MPRPLCARIAKIFISSALLLSGIAIMAQEKPDLSVINRIKAESLFNSKVMDTMFYLTDVYGPRLTNSPNHYAAGDWAVKRLEEYGLVNVHLEKWGPFGRSWSNKYYEGHMVEPRFASLTGVPLAWTSGTGGSISAEPVLAVIRTEADMEKFKGKLKGKIAEPFARAKSKSREFGRTALL
jgi:carboxypeptidase Q